MFYALTYHKPTKKILTELELDKTIGFIFSYVPVSIIFFSLFLIPLYLNFLFSFLLIL